MRGTGRSLRRERDAQALRDPVVMVTGFRECLFLDVPTGDAWQYRGDQQYAIGASLMYRRSWILTHPFPARQIGEDNHVVRIARETASLRVLDNPGLLVCRTHSGCVTRRQHVEDGVQWTRAAVSDLPPGFNVR